MGRGEAESSEALLYGTTFFSARFRRSIGASASQSPLQPPLHHLRLHELRKQEALGLVPNTMFSERRTLMIERLHLRLRRGAVELAESRNGQSTEDLTEEVFTDSRHNRPISTPVVPWGQGAYLKYTSTPAETSSSCSPSVPSNTDSLCLGVSMLSANFPASPPLRNCVMAS